MKVKTNQILLTSLFVVSLMLMATVGALAAPGDPAFTTVGLLSVTGTPAAYTVNGQAIVVDAATICTDLTPAAVLCPSLNGQLVEVVGYISAADTLHYATSISAKATSATFNYSGELMSFSNTAWEVGAYTFLVGPTTTEPPFFAIGDTIGVTYTVNITSGAYLASAFTLLSSASDNSYTYKGELKSFTDTTWTVGDYTFTLGPGVVLPPLFGAGDIVEVTFQIVNGEYIATSVEVIETVVPIKTESSRCDNGREFHPGVMKVAQEVGEDPAKIMEYFCAGFGLGEIRLAYRYADGSAYTPAMLLTLRASGLGWGEVKKMAAGMPADDSGEPEAALPGQKDKQQGSNGQNQRFEKNPGSNGQNQHPDTNPGSNAPDKKSDKGNHPDKAKAKGKNK